MLPVCCFPFPQARVLAPPLTFFCQHFPPVTLWVLYLTLWFFLSTLTAPGRPSRPTKFKYCSWTCDFKTFVSKPTAASPIARSLSQFLLVPTYHHLQISFSSQRCHSINISFSCLPLFLSLWVIWILNSNCYQYGNTFYTLVIFPSSQKNYFPPSHPHCNCSGSFELSTDTQTVFKTLFLPNYYF